MSFLAPLWLSLAAFAAVPLLLHLRRRPVVRRLVFPAVRWLARAQREHGRELRLRNLALMALRVAAVLALAAAAAGPFVRGLPGGHAPTALAIVLDNSLSTTRAASGEAVFEPLRAAALALVDGLSSSDRGWLVTADGAVVGGTAAQVRAAVRAARPWAGAGDLPAAVERAATLATTADGLAPRVAILTDGQASAWPRTARATGVQGVVVHVPTDAVADAPVNFAVVAATPVPPRWSPRGRLRVRVAGPDTVPVVVELAGRTLARGRAAPGADLLVPASPVERGWVAGRVQGPPDALRGDDARAFAAWIGPAPAVAVDASAGRFAAAAIAALAADGRVRPGDDIAVVRADRLRRLPALVLPPADGSGLAAANAALARLEVPWRYEAAAVGGTTAAGEAWLAGARVTRRWRLEAVGAADRPGRDTLATAGGDAWWVAAPGAVLLGSPLDTAATDAIVRAGFVPWLGELFAARLAGDGGPLLAAAPGGRVTWPWPPDAIEREDGTRLPASGRAMTAPSEPGVYYAVRRGVRSGALVVNPEDEESVLATWSARGVTARVSGGRVEAADSRASLVRGAFGRGGGLALLGPALAAALVLLAAEGLVARQGRAA